MVTLQRLTYASRVAISPPELSSAVADILRSSVVNNASLSITGMLVSHAGFFVQALEGPARAVEATYARVEDDRRHRSAKILLRETVEYRLFGSWAMCAQTVSTTDDQILKVLALKGAFDPFNLNPRAALRLLTTVATIRGRDARVAA